MEHGEVTHAKGFGHNTNGVGLLIVSIVAVCLALFCWNFWKDGSKETEHYRLESQTTQSASHEGHGETQGGHEASGAGTVVEPASTHEAVKADTLEKAATAPDSSSHADSSHR